MDIPHVKQTEEEVVVLVDEDNHEIGTAPKATVHANNTPLHRGFSLFLFNSKGQLLLTRRALTKKTFPGVWTNTVCGHPGPGESVEDAARRRLYEELGVSLGLNPGAQGSTLSQNIRVVTPYCYRFADQNGIVENEICPVLVAHADVEPHPNKAEIEEWKWIDWQEFLNEVETLPQKYSPWSREETRLLTALPA
ncbi:isopentenyl-diphosphate Delta-isomerase [Patescibacteria group bacterium]|nr:isopentenyl-diphosphate Delta-isomerase [Patescibacteria group bacterium]